MFKHALIVFLFLYTLTGCSVLKYFSDDVNKDAVQYATEKIIERPNVSAEAILKLVAKAKNYVTSSDTVLVSTLADGARERLAASSLSFAEQILIDAILQNAQDRLEERLGSSALSDTERVKLLTVLDWIEEAANVHTAVPS